MYRVEAEESYANYPGIYAIINRANGHQYIGSSINIAKRWVQHERDLDRGTHCNPYLQNAWDKYGSMQFSFEVRERTSSGTLKEREQWWISTVQPDYNIQNAVVRDDLPGNKFGLDCTLERQATVLLRRSAEKSRKQYPVLEDRSKVRASYRNSASSYGQWTYDVATCSFEKLAEEFERCNDLGEPIPVWGFDFIAR